MKRLPFLLVFLDANVYTVIVPAIEMSSVFPDCQEEDKSTCVLYPFPKIALVVQITLCT